MLIIHILTLLAVEWERFMDHEKFMYQKGPRIYLKYDHMIKVSYTNGYDSYFKQNNPQKVRAKFNY